MGWKWNYTFYEICWFFFNYRHLLILFRSFVKQPNYYSPLRLILFWYNNIMQLRHFLTSIILDSLYYINLFNLYLIDISTSAVSLVFFYIYHYFYLLRIQTLTSYIDIVSYFSKFYNSSIYWWNVILLLRFIKEVSNKFKVCTPNKLFKFVYIIFFYSNNWTSNVYVKCTSIKFMHHIEFSKHNNNVFVFILK